MIPNSEPVFSQSTINVIAIKRLGQESGGKKYWMKPRTAKNFLSICYLPDILGTSVRKKCLTHSSSESTGNTNNLSAAGLRKAAAPSEPKSAERKS